MTNLEKALGAALVVATVYAVGVTITTIKNIKGHIKFCNELQAKAENIQNVLNETKVESE